MTANIITFPGAHAATRPATPSKGRVRVADAATENGQEHLPENRSDARSDARRKKDAKSRSVEPNIQEIPGENGGRSYRVQIRKSVDGTSISFTKTFSKLAMARKWKKRKLVEIELNGVQTVSRSGHTVAEAITARLATHKSLERSAKQQLGWLKASHIGEKKLSELSLDALTDLADDMLGEERQPQTVAGYLTILVNTLDWASRRGFSVPVAALKQAMEQTWEDEIPARSEERDRRPAIDELNKILKAVVENKRQKIPLAKIAVFAIFSYRRLGEICRLRWEDLRVTQKKILVRDMKRPQNRIGNDVWCKLTDEALAIIQSMPREGEFILFSKATSVGTAWRRHRVRLKIDNLRFHDLRHEGITRLFEMGSLQLPIWEVWEQFGSFQDIKRSARPGEYEVFEISYSDRNHALSFLLPFDESGALSGPGRIALESRKEEIERRQLDMAVSREIWADIEGYIRDALPQLRGGPLPNKHICFPAHRFWVQKYSN